MPSFVKPGFRFRGLFRRFLPSVCGFPVVNRVSDLQIESGSPQPPSAQAHPMPSFVVLEHDHPRLHWDLMLDTGDALRTWRLGALPKTGVTTDCESLPDHRRAYLDYEGPVSGGRGRVSRVIAGQYELIQESAGELRLRLAFPGGILEATLTPTAGAGQAVFASGDRSQDGGAVAC